MKLVQSRILKIKNNSNTGIVNAQELSLNRKALVLGAVRKGIFYSSEDVANKYPIGVYYFNVKNEEIFRYIFALGMTSRNYIGTETEKGKFWSVSELNTLHFSKF